MGSRTIKVVVVALAVIGFSVASWALWQQHPHQLLSQVVFHERAWGYTAPPGATMQDRDNFFHNLAYGSNDPTTLVMDGYWGSVKAVLTGLVLQPSGERQLTVTVHDDADDVQMARVYVNSQLAATGTVANGGIVVRNGEALATMSVLVLPAGAANAVEAEWISITGFVRRTAAATNN